MNQLSQYNNKQRLITQINSKEFLIEGHSESAKLKFENDPSNASYVEFQNGPILMIGDNFLGHGKSKNIQTINDGRDTGYMMIKISI